MDFRRVGKEFQRAYSFSNEIRKNFNCIELPSIFSNKILSSSGEVKFWKNKDLTIELIKSD